MEFLTVWLAIFKCAIVRMEQKRHYEINDHSYSVRTITISSNDLLFYFEVHCFASTRFFVILYDKTRTIYCLFTQTEIPIM